MLWPKLDENFMKEPPVPVGSGGDDQELARMEAGLRRLRGDDGINGDRHPRGPRSVFAATDLEHLQGLGPFQRSPRPPPPPPARGTSFMNL